MPAPAPGVGRHHWGRLGSLAALLAIFAALVLPPMFLGRRTMFAHADMVHSHLPQINYFTAHPLSVVEYPPTSPTTPGHHVMLAWAARVMGEVSVGETTWSLRLINALVAAGFISAAWTIFWRLGAGAGGALALALPLVGSPFVLGSAIWITSDDGAWLFYALLLAALLFRPQQPGLASACALLLVLWRQIYLPVAGVCALAGFGQDGARPPAKAFLAPVPAVLAVAAYALYWGGFTPHIAQSNSLFSFNLAVPLSALALTGLFALPYGVFLREGLRIVPVHLMRKATALAAAIAFVVWIGTRSDHDPTAGRFGSVVWTLAEVTPAIAGRSIIVLILAVLGAAALALMAVHAWHQRYRPIELGALLTYFIGYCSQPFAWQRYVEPALLLTFGIFATRQITAPRRAFAGPVACGVVLAGLSQARIWGLLSRGLG